MIKLKDLIKENWESDEEHEKWKHDWLQRYKAKFDEKGRLIAYHGTPKKNVKSIKQNGFKKKSYFSLDPNYSKRVSSIYHDTPEDKIFVFEVHLPLDAVDFVASDIYSVRPLEFEEVV